jgi:tellurite resistance-related uncharacterized protein
MIEAMRSLMDYLEAPVFKKNTVKMIGCPKSRTEEDIWVRLFVSIEIRLSIQYLY